MKIALLSASLVLANATAYAQVSVKGGTSVSVNLGDDVKVGHASEFGAGIDDKGTLNAKGAVADGLRVGDSKFKSSVHGEVSAPAAAVGAMLE